MNRIFNTWTHPTTGQIRHYFNGRKSLITGVTLDEFGALDEVNGEWNIAARDRSRIMNSLKALKVWIDEDGKAHVENWDARLTIVTSRMIADAAEAAYAAENAPAEETTEAATAAEEPIKENTMNATVTETAATAEAIYESTRTLTNGQERLLETIGQQDPGARVTGWIDREKFGRGPKVTLSDGSACLVNQTGRRKSLV